MVEINWESSIEQIKQSYTLTDEQVKEGLCILNNARKLYSGQRDDLPECIMFLDRNGAMLHKIMIRGGIPHTVKMRLNFMQRNRTKLIVTTSLIIGTLMTCYLGYRFKKYSS